MTQSTPKISDCDCTNATPLAQFRPPAAAAIRKTLSQARALAIRIIGPPGAGKTELIEATLKNLMAPRRVAVIVVNPASERDGKRLDKVCGRVAQVDSAIPTASSIYRIIAGMKLADLDIVLIEAAGGLAPLQDLGQDATVAVLSVSGGDDKAAEYHTLLNSASAVVLTKTDLLQHVNFDSQTFGNDVRSINPSAEIHELSARTGIGIDSWIAWLERMRLAKRRKADGIDQNDSPPDSFVG